MRVLVLCKEDFEKDPRPKRVITFFKEKKVDLTVLSSRAGKSNDVEIFTWNLIFRSNILFKIIYRIGELNLLILSKIFNTYYSFSFFNWIINYKTNKILKSKKFDIIVVHNIELLPMCFRIKDTKTKILFDAREYYVENFNDQIKWRILVKPFMHFLTKKYMKKCTWVVTVSDGLSRAYKENYNIDSSVIMSMAAYSDLKPIFNYSNSFKIIHHGIASKSRQIERMIYMMDYVDSRFHLDLMLVKGNKRYWNYLNKLISERKNISLIQPVAFSEIIPFTNKYDIGLFLCYPSNFNLKHALPNKFFEFIQARLMILIGPSIEMMKIVNQENIGLVSENFEPEMLAKEINKLNSDMINKYKENVNITANYFNSNLVFEELNKIIFKDESSNY